MRVLHINSYYSVGPFYRGLFEAQLKLGESVTVFVPVARGVTPSFDLGVFADVSEDHGRYDRLMFPVKHAKILRDATSRYAGQDYDVIHAHSLFSNGYVAWKLSKRMGIPYVVAVRDTDVNTFFRRMPHMRRLGRAILRDAARVVFLSAPYRDAALIPYLSADELQAVRAKSGVIVNGIDRFWLNNVPEAPRAPSEDAIRLVLVGRASRRKNVLAALDAAKILIDEGRDVRFDVVIGLVEDESILEEIRKRPFVTLHSNLTREQLLPVLRGSNVFVLPSLSETFGLVYAEAMSQGLPVLFTRGQGFDGQFPDGHVGYAVDPHDPAQIARHIEDALRNHAALASACLAECRRYDWDAIAARYDSIYRELMAREGAPR